MYLGEMTELGLGLRKYRIRLGHVILESKTVVVIVIIIIIIVVIILDGGLISKM